MNAVVIDTPEGIARYNLIVLRGQVKLESKGMRRSRGPSARKVAILTLKLPRNSSYSEVIDAISLKLDGSAACPECKYNMEYCTCQK